MPRSVSFRWLVLPVLALFGAVGASPARAGDFVNFESAHVHPIALSESGRQLFAVNTPEARLAVFRVTRRGELVFRGDVPVGLEPVSLAVRPGGDEVWVVNHVSDSVSIVDVASLRVIDTLSVGDEPTDVVFARGRAYVSLAGAEDRVAVYDADSLEEVARIEIFGDDPRALAVSPDGSRVGLVVLESGNGTTTVHASQFTPERQPPPPSPPRDPFFPPGIPELPAPLNPLIVQHDLASGEWRDELGADWSDKVFFGDGKTLPDHDLFLIDAEAPEPTVVATVPRVGTNLFDVDFHPQTGEAWVPNTESRNQVRFEPVLRGHLVETRISRVDPVDGGVAYLDLNPHIDRSTTPGPPEEIARSLAIPGDGVFSRNGRRYYVTAFGSAKVAVLDARRGRLLRRIDVGGGPSGLALHPRLPRLYVMQRFSNTITVVDTARLRATGEMGVAGPNAFDPSPPEIREGRHFLYDGRLSSGHGDISCATCHVFANFDGLGWDLGDPQGDFVPFADAPWLVDLATPHLGFDPMKGPMVTQTLRGLRGTEPLHWRGDRANFQHFNGAFVSLLGRDEPLPDADMDAFTDFIMTVEYPPNPHRLLDDSLPPTIPDHGSPALGKQIFENVAVTPAGIRCVVCHQPPFGTSHQIQQAGDQSTEVAHLRNLYEKLGRDRFDEGPEPAEHVKTGFGIQHAGANSLELFLIVGSPALGENRPDMRAFLASFPTGTFPCVGHQLGVGPEPAEEEVATLATLLGQSALGRCDVVASGHLADEAVGYVYDAQDLLFLPDSTRRGPAAPAALLASLAGDDLVTFMGVPPGSGQRLGVDRDRDACLDGDEVRQGTDPAHAGTPTPDADGDGLPDEADLCPGWEQRDHDQRDRDRDGRPDECECGDVSGDGRVGWRDVQLLWLHLRGYGRPGIALEKCNVVGPAGNDPALCDEADLAALRDAVWSRLRPWSREPVSLEPRCWSDAAPPDPVPLVCVD